MPGRQVLQFETPIARLVGALFIVATAAAVVGDLLLRPLRDDADYLTRFDADENRVILAVLSELTLALAVIGIAVLLFPILERTNVGAALGYVGVRILEGVIVLIGGISSLLLFSLSRDHIESGATTAGGDEALGAMLLEARDWTDSLGTTVVFGISALVLYSLTYRSRSSLGGSRSGDRSAP